jgi:MerR-like DNA binding protein
MNALPRGRGNTVSPWVLDRDLVYAITARKRVPDRACDGAAQVSRAAESTELETLTATELAQFTGTNALDLKRLVDCGVLSPLAPDTCPWEFRASLVAVLRRAQRMREDLALNDDEFALATLLLLEIDKIEAELRLARLAGIVGLAEGASADDPSEA